MKQIRDILKEAVSLQASDIHLTIGSPAMLRVNGELIALDKVRLSDIMLKSYLRSMVNEESIERFQSDKQLDFSYYLTGVGQFRLNAYHQRGQIAMAIRPVPSEIPALTALDLPPIVQAFAEKTRGLVLVTGPTGSGKSTTLASMIQYLNETTRKHIITLEDPIEFNHPNRNCVINQREIGEDAKDFASALRVALRQDPDVIMLGELRDIETIQTALTAAETGHLVLATLHTSSAASTVERIIDVFPAERQAQIRVQLAGSLVGVVAQQLFKRQDLSGRTGAFEILVNTPAVSNMIRQGKTHQIQNIIQTSRQYGMQSMESQVKQKLTYGMISLEDAQAYLSSLKAD